MSIVKYICQSYIAESQTLDQPILISLKSVEHHKVVWKTVLCKTELELSFFRHELAECGFYEQRVYAV